MQKKYLTLVLVLLLSILGIACSKKDNSVEQINNNNPISKLVIGLDDSFPPIGFRNEKNELVGFDVDMAKEAAKRLNVDLVLQPIDWAAKEGELNSKRIDVLWNGLTITEERKKNIAFTKPYMSNRQIIITKQKAVINNKDDLAGKVIGVQDASTAVQALEQEPEVKKSFKELRKFADNITALMDLEIGRIDAVIVDEVVGRYYVAKKADKFKVLEQDFGREKYGVGLRLEDKQLLQQIDATLDAMKADGTAKRIAVKWFGNDVIE